MLKFSALLYLCLFLILIVAGVLLWAAASSAGLIENIEGFIESLFAFESFEFDVDRIFRASVVGGAVLVVALTGLNVLLALLFNLISDLVGGIRLTVIEEDVPVRRTVV